MKIPMTYKNLIFDGVSLYSSVFVQHMNLKKYVNKNDLPGLVNSLRLANSATDIL